jgi:FKBP-type peptidyl-prolyl cis-trans isomerase (trigger factor)
MNERRKIMLSEQRKGEIALKLLKHIKKEEGIKLQAERFQREIGNMAKTLDIPKEELKEFARELVEELVADCFK